MHYLRTIGHNIFEVFFSTPKRTAWVLVIAALVVFVKNPGLLQRFVHSVMYDVIGPALAELLNGILTTVGPPMQQLLAYVLVGALIVFIFRKMRGKK